MQLGDVNGDNVTDGRDATDILTEYAKTSAGLDSMFDASRKAAAEVTGDDVIDGRDATLVLTYYAYSSAGHNISLSEFLSLSL